MLLEPGPMVPLLKTGQAPWRKSQPLVMMENGEELGNGERGPVDRQAGGEGDNWSKDEHGAGTT